MLSREYFDTARTLLRVAQGMINQAVARIIDPGTRPEAHAAIDERRGYGP